MISFFTGYFAKVEYLEWSDVEPPLIHVSRDGQISRLRLRFVHDTLSGQTPQ